MDVVFFLLLPLFLSFFFFFFFFLSKTSTHLLTFYHLPQTVAFCPLNLPTPTAQPPNKHYLQIYFLKKTRGEMINRVANEKLKKGNYGIKVTFTLTVILKSETSTPTQPWLLFCLPCISNYKASPSRAHLSIFFLKGGIYCGLTWGFFSLHS